MDWFPTGNSTLIKKATSHQQKKKSRDRSYCNKTKQLWRQNLTELKSNSFFLSHLEILPSETFSNLVTKVSKLHSWQMLLIWQAQVFWATPFAWKYIIFFNLWGALHTYKPRQLQGSWQNITSVSLTPVKQLWQDLTETLHAFKSYVERAAKRSRWLKSHYYYLKESQQELQHWTPQQCIYNRLLSLYA